MSRIPSLSYAILSRKSSSCRTFARPCLVQRLHNSASSPANVLPVTATGPPPEPPLPAASQYGERVDRRRRQAQLVKKGQTIRANQSSKPGSALRRRFWKDVSVKTTPEGHHTVHLDSRPVRHAGTKFALPIPASKPHLATAIALEWDLLVSAQEALKTHLVPLTSLASRAHDIALQDAAAATEGTPSPTRDEIVKMLMRYLDTDTLLCWAPTKSRHDFDNPAADLGTGPKETLREVQIRTALPILSFLTTRVWPGIDIRPVLDEDSIVPTPQPQETQDVIRGWIGGLGPWELAGLERAVLAGKSLCVGARLVVEWSEEFVDLKQNGEERLFGIGEAAEACSLEVSWQTRMWGEVEDSHDVEKEDVKRQFGSAVMVVSGTGV